MNRDITGNYPSGNILQQAADNSFQSHLGQNWQHPSNNQHTSQYPTSAPFFPTCNSDYAYPQQTTSAWNNWSEQNNNTSNSYSSMPPAMSPQVHPTQWTPNTGPQLNCYLDSNNEQQHQNLQSYYVGAPDYAVSQVHDPTSWQQVDHQPQNSHWELQPQIPLETGVTEPALSYPFDANIAPVPNNKMEMLAGQMQQCSLAEPAHLEPNFVAPLKNLVEESNQEVLPSFQQVESLPATVIPPPPVELIEGQPLVEPSAILPRKGSPFQPPVPSVFTPSSEQPTTVKPELIPTDLALQPEVRSSGPVDESTSLPWAIPLTPEIKQESICDPVLPPVSQSIAPAKQQEVEAIENPEETSSSSGSRPNPLHLVLHRQHFSNDVDESCRTTLWENPIVSIPNVTLMPLAKQSQANSSDNTEENKDASQTSNSTQKVDLEVPSSEVRGSSPCVLASQKGQEEDAVRVNTPSNIPQLSPVATATNSPLKKSREDVSFSEMPPQDPAGRISPPPVDRRWTEAPEKPRQDQNRDDRNYSRKMPPPPPQHQQQQQGFPDQPPDSRHFRPAGYYPPPSGNYSSRPSSRASEPTGENYYHEHERTPSRMSEINDDRSGRDYEYSRSRNSGYRVSDHSRRRYDDERDADHRYRSYEPRDNYDYRGRNSGRDSADHLFEQDRNRSDYVDGDLEFDHQRQRYPDRYYARPRQDNGYFMRPGANKGYDYYSSWPDPYAMFYAQYYHNYQTAAYGSRNNYGYHKELYETDPKYRQQVDNYQAYYNSQQAQMGYDSDQHSIHSGRSSVTEELRRDRVEHNQEYSDSLLGDSLTQPSPPRITPVKFSCAHSIGHLNQGKIIAVLPNYSSFTCPVNIYDVQTAFTFDPCLKDMKNYPGPLISGQTHKKDVMSFCQLKVQELQTSREQVLDRSSQILLWELLILLVRQNGNVIGGDIAELLLKDVRNISVIQTPTSTHTTGTSPLNMLSDDLRDGPSSNSSINNNQVDPSPSSTPSPDEGIVVSQDRTLINKELSMEQVTQKFTEYLLYGNKKDALEWAVRHNLWGHALFLAYRMGSHSHANLMTRFANSLPLNDPLQTLYQLMSGRQPISVTSVADEKWGDWRPHLAMILSNPTSNPQVDLRSIVTLGDTLAQKGCLYAAHFCYLMAQVEFGTHDNKASKYVLLSANHRLSFENFATNEAIHLTEIYEYAMSLGKPNYMLSNFQPYKFLYASRLADYGLLKEALQYCEVMSTSLSQFPSYVSLSLFKQLHSLGNRLKYHDPHYMHNAGEFEELGDPPWLTQLHDMVNHLKENGVSTRENFAPLGDQLQGNYSQDTSQIESYSSSEYQQQVPQQSISEEEARVTSGSVEQISMEAWNNYTYPINYSYNQGPTELAQESEKTSQLHSSTIQSEPIYQEEPNSSSPSYYDQIPTLKPPFSSQGSQNLYSTHTRERQDSVDSTTSRTGSFSARPSNIVPASREEGGTSPNIPQTNRANQQTKQDNTKKQDAGKPQAGRSWFGSIMNKFLPKGPNPMILPDDKAPRIVWDEKTNMWVDLDGNADDVANANLPPPKDSELASLPSTGGKFAIPSPSASPSDQNRFQRPKHRGMRQNYVDILNSNVASSGNQNTSSTASDSLFPKMETSAEIPSNFFIPSAVNISDSTSNLSKPDANDYLSPDRRSSIQDAETNQSPLLNPADFNMTAIQDMGGTRKPNVGRLTGRRAYPS